MREIEITYTDVTIEEVVIELAKYVESGYSIVSVQQEVGHYLKFKITINLVKS